MEGPKKIYLFPGIASGYESRTFPDEIEYIRADLVRESVEAAEEVLKESEHLGTDGGWSSYQITDFSSTNLNKSLDKET